MCRRNVILSVVLASAFASAVRAAENDSLSVDMAGAPASQFTALPGFSFKGNSLVLPNGQTVEKVSGIQACEKAIIVVCQREIGVYRLQQKKYSVVPFTSPLSQAATLTLIPFDADASENPKAHNRYALIAIKEADVTNGVLLYEVQKEDLQYLSISGSKRPVDGELWSWNIYQSDVVGAPNETHIGFSSTNGRVRYFTRLNGKNLVPITPKSDSPSARDLARVKEKYERQQAKLKGAKSDQ